MDWGNTPLPKGATLMALVGVLTIPMALGNVIPGFTNTSTLNEVATSGPQVYSRTVIIDGLERGQ